MATEFFLIFLATVLVTRIFVYLFPIPAPTVNDFRMHHWMFGLLGVIVGVMFHSLFIYAVGLGLFVDELTYLLIRGKTHKDNYSKKSILGTIAFILLVFILKDYLVALI